MMDRLVLKKSLGQHFLINEAIAMRMVSLLPTTVPQIIEIGPGGGVLSKYLLHIPNIDLKAVEVDSEKIQYLSLHYPMLKVIQANILDIDCPFEGYFQIIGNFPYNISTQILFKVIAWRQHVPFVLGMFQKEVAQRIAASPHSKEYGILSVLMQAFYDVTYLFDVPPESFIPPPKVMSGVISLLKKNDAPMYKNETLFFVLVKKAFNQRRKMLRNALSDFFPKERLKDPIFSNRAEDLTVKDFCKLTYDML